MRLHALLIVAILFNSSVYVHCELRPLGSILDRHRRDDFSDDDIFTIDDGNEDSLFAAPSGDDMASFTDEDHLEQDGLSSENPNDLESFITNPSEEFANPSEKIASQDSSCGQLLRKRDGSQNDLILSN